MENSFESEEIGAFRLSPAKFLAEEVWPHVEEWDEAGVFSIRSLDPLADPLRSAPRSAPRPAP